MSRIAELARTVTTEAVTESATAEVAIALLIVAAVVFAAGVVLTRRVYAGQHCAVPRSRSRSPGWPSTFASTAG